MINIETAAYVSTLAMDGMNATDQVVLLRIALGCMEDSQTTRTCPSTPEWISQATALPVEEIQQSLMRLKRKGYLDILQGSRTGNQPEVACYRLLGPWSGVAHRQCALPAGRSVYWRDEILANRAARTPTPRVGGEGQK